MTQLARTKVSEHVRTGADAGQEFSARLNSIESALGAKLDAIGGTLAKLNETLAAVLKPEAVKPKKGKKRAKEPQPPSAAELLASGDPPSATDHFSVGCSTCF